MLDHDELLLAEQASPRLVQELQAVYVMTPAEKQVLARVHERLAQSSQALPIRESVQSAGRARPGQLPLSPSSRLPRRERGWLRGLNTLAAVIVIGLLVGSLAFTFAVINHSSVGSPHQPVGATSTIRILLAPVDTGSAPSQAAMEATRTLLSERFASFGLKGVSVRLLAVNGQTDIQIELPHFGGNEQQTIDTLVKTGALAFWGTGSGSFVPVGTIFNPDKYVRYNPGGQPRFTNQDLDLNTLTITSDQAGRPQITCTMKGDAINRFRLYTASNVGYFLTVTLDGKVLYSAVIQSSISGPFNISGNFTQQQASAILAVLKSGPLPVSLKIVP